MPTPALDQIREGVLRRMDRQARMIRFAIFGAALLEMLMLATALFLIDWDDRTQILLLVLSVLGYSIVVLGMVALGAHVSKAVSQLALALHGS